MQIATPWDHNQGEYLQKIFISASLPCGSRYLIFLKKSTSYQQELSIKIHKCCYLILFLSYFPSILLNRKLIKFIIIYYDVSIDLILNPKIQYGTVTHNLYMDNILFDGEMAYIMIIHRKCNFVQSQKGFSKKTLGYLTRLNTVTGYQFVGSTFHI